MRHTLVLVCLVMLGCSDSSIGLPDLSMPILPPDMAQPLPDLMATDDMPIFGGTQHAKFSSATVTLPTSASKYAYDLDGDGTNDNRLGSIISALSALGQDPQAAATAGAQAGTLVFLFDESSGDATQQSDPAAAVTLATAQAAASAPKYDGTDTFTVDSSTTPAKFGGAITAGTFASLDPATATVPVSITLVLPLFPASAPLVLPVTGAHLTFTRSTAGVVTLGQINGGIKKTDIDSKVLPALAASLTAQLMADPQPTLQMFDTNHDGTITAAELQGNALIANFLAPDVQLFQGGVYKPNPLKTQKDSVSMGIGFTGVTASF